MEKGWGTKEGEREDIREKKVSLCFLGRNVGRERKREQKYFFSDFLYLASAKIEGKAIAADYDQMFHKKIEI